MCALNKYILLGCFSYLIVLFLGMTGGYGQEAKILLPVSGRDPNNIEAVLPADVLARVELLRDDLELVRKEIGKPKARDMDLLEVEDVAPREVFFQALRLCKSANRLSCEIVRAMSSEPTIPHDKNICPMHVWHVVNKAYQQILIVKKELGISEKCREKEQSVSTTPTQVFRAIIKADQQLNLLLEQRFTASDIFQQVTLAVHYTARLLAQFPGVERIPDAPPYERHKLPEDVYRQLAVCFSLVEEIANQSGLETLTFHPRKTSHFREIDPHVVYIMVTLIIGELAYIHSQIPGIKKPRNSYYPDYKIFSDVFQRAGVLQKQLHMLKELTAQKTSWLQQNKPKKR